MPYTWIQPPVALRRKGIKVYYVFRHDDATAGDRRSYHFGISPDASDDGIDTFDVRDLPNWTSPASNTFEDKHIKNIIRDAIDKGIIYQDGDEVRVKE